MAALTLGLAAVLMTTPDTFARRAQDWRNGPVVYQVFVDRFAPAADLQAKRALYPAPRKLMTWDQTPKAGRLDPALGSYTHELEFWGGDLQSLRGRLDYVEGIGADVVYLNPIFKALTNHKYDTQDYFAVADNYGTRDDLRSLQDALHGRGMRLMLDGVFNHMGRTAPRFLEAQGDPKSRYRSWFVFDPRYKSGYRGWAGVANLPALNLDDPGVRDFLWRKDDSVVQTYLREGLDGWRLDVAFDLGPEVLAEITAAAHKAKPDSVVVGEISGYPSDWAPAVDGVFNFFPLSLGRDMLAGRVAGGRIGTMLDQMVEDAGIETVLKSWLLLDNHDTPRLVDQVPDPADRKLCFLLQVTLPGAPVVYYGTELGMAGDGDPANRAPMRWDLVTDSNETLAWVRSLLTIRKAHPALRYGDFKALATDRLLAYVRTTEKLRETVLVVVNPTETAVTETFATRVGRIMSWGELDDLLSDAKTRSINGLMRVTVPPKTARLFVPITDLGGEFKPYERIP